VFPVLYPHYNYFKEKLSYFTNLGVKGYKIDRGEEGEMPGKPSTLPHSPYSC